MAKQREFEFNLARRRRCTMCGAQFVSTEPMCDVCRHSVDKWRKGFVKGAELVR